MKIINRPNCVKCKENPAFINISGYWLCGECYEKVLAKQRKLNEKLIFEE